MTKIQAYFETAVSTITTTPTFQTWAASLLKPAEPFAEFFNREPLLCIAAVKFGLLQEPGPGVAPLRHEKRRATSQVATSQVATSQVATSQVASSQVAASSTTPLPDDLPLIAEMLEPLAIDDWLTLLETFG